MSAAAATLGARRGRMPRQGRLFDPSRRHHGARPTPTAPASAGPSGTGATGLTLGAKLAGVWEGLAVAGSAACPLCGAEMRREPGRAEGTCTGCGSTLA